MVPELHLINNLNSLGSLATELVASHAFDDAGSKEY